MKPTRTLRILVSTVALMLAGATCDSTDPADPTGIEMEASSRIRGLEVRRISQLIVIGNSLSDVGNVADLQPGAAAPPYYQKRLSNGPLWVDVLADELGVDEPVASAEAGLNYAVGGAETGPGFAALLPIVPNMGRQVEALLRDVGRIDERALVVIRGGANDLIAQALLEPPEETVRTPERAVANLEAHVRQLAAAGATRFLVANLADFAEVPLLALNGVQDDARRWEAEFNAHLGPALERLEEELAVPVRLFDAADLSKRIRSAPADFGLTNTTDPACPGCGFGTPEPDADATIVADPDQHYYWDLAHPTRRVHGAFGREAAVSVRSWRQPPALRP